MPSTFKRFGISSGGSSPSKHPHHSSSSSEATLHPPAAYFTQSTSYSPHDYEDEDLYSWNQPTKNKKMTSNTMTIPTINNPATSRRHSRMSSISSETSSNGGFLNNLFSSNYSVGNASSTSFASTAASQPQSRPQTRQGSVANRRFSFFGLGANASNTSTNSLLAFSSASSTVSVASSRCCSRCSRAPSIAPPLGSPIPNTQVEDEFKDMDFETILNVPASPLSCTPAALKRLQEQSLEIIENLHRSYIARTEALKSAFAEIDALKEDMEEKLLSIETLEEKVHALTNVQDSLSRACEDAEKTAKATQDKLDEMVAERNRKQSQTTIRMVDRTSKGSSEGYYYEEDDSLASAQRFTRGFQSNNSDSGFESEEDSHSLFSEGSPFDSKRSSVQVGTESGLRSSFSHLSMADELTPPVSPTKPFPPANYQSFTPPRAAVAKKSILRSTPSRCECGSTSPNDSWMVMKLREENQELKDCISACLDVVNGHF